MKEFHLTVRVNNLKDSLEFYKWLFDVEPKTVLEGRYATLIVPQLGLNMVMIQARETPVNQSKVHHIGFAVRDRDAVLNCQDRAKRAGVTVSDEAKTTWRGTAMHQLWLEDPDGTKVEIYSRLTDEELAQAPDDKEPVPLAG